MGYENAPATKMLAARCAVCARPLLDAVSVESGLGPDCRRKYGFNQEVAPELRAEANKIVYEIALKQTGAVVGWGCQRLRALGFNSLAERIEKRAIAVRIQKEGGRLLVKTPYSDEVAAAFRLIPGRRWDRERKVNVIPVNQRRALWALLCRHFDGEQGVGPKGVFTIGAAPNASAEARLETYRASA